MPRFRHNPTEMTAFCYDGTEQSVIEIQQNISRIHFPYDGTNLYFNQPGKSLVKVFPGEWAAKMQSGTIQHHTPRYMQLNYSIIAE